MAELTREQLIERAQLLAQAKAKAAAAGNMSPEPGIENAPNPIVSGLDKLKYGLRALGYGRTAVGVPLEAGAMGMATGKDVFDSDRYKKALMLQADPQSTNDMMQKADLMSDSPNARAVVGVAGDIATDPATYGGMFLSRLKNAQGLARGAEVALNPVENFMESRGKSLYQSAMQKLDSKAVENGKTLMPSEILQNEKFVGNMGDAADKLKEVNDTAGKEIGSVLTEASQRGGKVDVDHVFQPALDEATKLRKMLSPEAHDLADKIETRVQYMKDKVSNPEFWNMADHSGMNTGPETTIPVDQANQEKSFLNNLIKTSGYNQGAEAAIGTQSRKAVASDLASGVPEAVDKVDPTLGARLRAANAKYASTDPTIVDEATRIGNTAPETRSPLIPTWGDLMMATGGATAGAGMGDPAAGALLAVGAKKGTQLATSTLGRTARGAAATTISENANGVLDPVLRRSVWGALNQATGDDNGK